MDDNVIVKEYRCGDLGDEDFQEKEGIDPVSFKENIAAIERQRMDTTQCTWQ